MYSILQDMWYISCFDKIPMLSAEEIEKIKNKTLSKEAFEKLWYDKYQENLFLILKYQKETNAPIIVIWKTLFHIISSIVKNKGNSSSDSDYIILWILQFFLYIEEFWPEKPKVEEEDFSDDENKIKNKQEKNYIKIWYNFWIALYKNKWLSTPEYWEKILFDWDFCKIIHKIYQMVWSEVWNNLYKISPKHIAFKFCIIYVAHFEYKQEINQEILEDSIFSPYQFGINNHPYTRETTENIKKYTKLCFENYKNPSKTQLYKEFSFDCGFINLLKQGKEFEEILKEIRLFKKKYSYITKKIKSPSFKIRWINEEDWEFLINQRLYFEMQESILVVKILLKEMEINDFRRLFSYLNYDLIQKYFRYNDLKFIESYSENKKRRNIMELSRIFLYQKIRQKEFDRIHSVYEEMKKDFLSRNLYNLVLGKFSLAFIKIWVSYFTEWYHILLKQMFKNFRLQTPDLDLESFNLPKESANDLWIYELENDEDIRDLIFDDEWIELEMKASICLDWLGFLGDGKKIELSEHSYLKPLVAFLNTRWGRIILWIWEGNKLDEEMKKWKITKKNLDHKGLKKQKKANNHYLTWIDEDLNMLSTTPDNLKQRIDEYIKNNVFPNPFINNDIIKVCIKKFLGKTIGIIDVPTGSTEYYIMKKDKKKQSTEYEIYIRQNASDYKIKSHKEAIEFSKSKKSNK